MTDDLKASLLLYLMLCVQVGDWLTTVWALAHGAYEANPIMAPLFAISPWLALLPKLAIPTFCVLIWSLSRKQSAITNAVLWCFGIAVVAGLPPVVWNLTQLARAGLL